MQDILDMNFPYPLFFSLLLLSGAVLCLTFMATTCVRGRERRRRQKRKKRRRRREEERRREKRGEEGRRRGGRGEEERREEKEGILKQHLSRHLNIAYHSIRMPHSIPAISMALVNRKHISDARQGVNGRNSGASINSRHNKPSTKSVAKK